jgi:hypothetical protein
MDINKVINNVLSDVANRTNSNVNLKNPYHQHLVRSGLYEHIDSNIVDTVMLSINEADDAEKKAFAKKYKFLSSNANLFYDELSKAGKLDDFEKFIKLLPNGGPTKSTQSALKKFSNADIVDLASFLYSKDEVKSGKMPTTPGAKKLFDIKPDGAGRGEVYLAALCKDSFIQGGSKSYDLETKKTKYEVKDYSTSSTAIRAGVEASVSKFKFWKQILKTIDVIKEVEAQGGWDLIPDSTEKQELINVKNHILDRVDNQVKIVTGEYNKTDKKYTEDFYNLCNKMLSVKSSDYNQVVFRGPNQKPKSVSIVPISPAEVKGTVTIEISNDASVDISQVVNYLNRLDYVRNPAAFDKDIETAMKQIIEKGDADKWIVFRGGNMKVLDSKGGNFNYESISQNGVKFKEL